MRELAVQMENGIYTSKDRDNAQLEVNALLSEIDKIASNTRFNDVAVLDGSYDQTIRAGNTNAETIRVAVGSVKTTDTAKIEAFAVEKAIDGGSDVATQNEMDVYEATSVTIDTSLFSSTFKETFKADSLGTFSIAAAGTASNADDDNGAFSIDAKTGLVTGKYKMDYDIDVQATDSGVAVGDAISKSVADNRVFKIQVTYTDRNNVATTENIELTLLDNPETGTNTSTLNTIEVETQAKATRAVETLDKALEQVSSAQAKLGAIQNRLQHNIDNLSKGAMLTEQAVGRVIDADFATETSNLSKQQILNQAATAMLAQANQSKQSVLSLLQ